MTLFPKPSYGTAPPLGEGWGEGSRLRIPHPQPSPQRLRDSYILLSHRNSIAACHGGEFVPSSLHGLWAWWFVITIPASEACDDPGEPSECAHFMGIFLTHSFTFQRWTNRSSRSDPCRISDIRCRSRASIPRVDELDRARGSRNCDCCKLKEAYSVLDLSFLQTQPV